MKSLLLVVLVFVFAIFLVSPSEAQKAPKSILLKGTYGSIGHDVCVGHWSTNPNPLAYEVYWTRTSTSHGTTVFDGTTTGTGETYSVSMTHPVYTPIPDLSYWPSPIQPTMSPVTTHLTSTVEYTIDPVTRFITQHTSGSGKFLSGTVGGHEAVGKTLTFSSDFNGYVSQDLGTITGSTPVSDPYNGEDYKVTTIILNDDDSIFGIQEEVCQRTRVLTKIK